MSSTSCESHRPVLARATTYSLPRRGLGLSAAGGASFERAGRDVVVDDADRLDQGVDDGGPHESEFPALEVLADAVGQVCCRRQVAERSRVVDDRDSVDPVPQVGRERPKFVLYANACLRVGAGAEYLQPVSDDAGVLAELFEPAVGEPGH